MESSLDRSQADSERRPVAERRRSERRPAGKVSRPRGVDAIEWRSLLDDLEEYRDRDPDDPYYEANEAAQSITERCIRLLLPDTAT